MGWHPHLILFLPRFPDFQIASTAFPFSTGLYGDGLFDAKSLVTGMGLHIYIYIHTINIFTFWPSGELLLDLSNVQLLSDTRMGTRDFDSGGQTYASM